MITAVPALKNLCFVAGLSILFNYFLLLTVLIPMLALDNKRIKSGRRDLICCFTKQSKIKPPRKLICKPWLQKNFVPFVFTNVNKIATISITICLIIISFFAIYDLPLGLSQTVLLEYDSDFYDYHLEVS